MVDGKGAKRPSGKYIEEHSGFYEKMWDTVWRMSGHENTSSEDLTTLFNWAMRVPEDKELHSALKEVEKKKVEIVDTMMDLADLLADRRAIYSRAIFGNKKMTVPTKKRATSRRR